MPRTFVGSLLAALMSLPHAVFAATPPAQSKAAVQAPKLYDFTVQTIDGEARSLNEYRGRTLLIVNTASRCGFTPQYASLEALYQKYKARGLVVLAFPANDFMGQEPGSNADIKTFCTEHYKVSFPLFAKLSVRGKQIAPLYEWLTKRSPFPGDIPWNFTKFLVSPEGQVVARFGPMTDPGAADVTAKLEKLLPALE
jgi:glutathione peroxidase